MPVELQIHVPRYGFSLRERARPGAIWRALQEAAVLGSASCGWPPHRYRAEGCAFVVRRMRVVHDDELRYGEALRATTWIRAFQRGLISHREIRLHAPDGRSIARATQEWVHVRFDADRGPSSLRPARASPELCEALAVEEGDASPELPDLTEPVDGPEHTLVVPLRLVEMDPLGHLNHPTYIDLADEHIARRLLDAGVQPVAVRPVAEQITFRAGLTAPGDVTLRSRALGRSGSSGVFAHHLHTPDGALAAEARTVRAVEGVPLDALIHAFTQETPWNPKTSTT